MRSSRWQSRRPARVPLCPLRAPRLHDAPPAAPVSLCVAEKGSSGGGPAASPARRRGRGRVGCTRFQSPGAGGVILESRGGRLADGTRGVFRCVRSWGRRRSGRRVVSSGTREALAQGLAWGVSGTPRLCPLKGISRAVPTGPLCGVCPRVPVPVSRPHGATSVNPPGRSAGWHQRGI